MNKQAFINLLKNPESITSSDLKGLEEVIENFPYFQAAQILAAKGARDHGKMLAEQKIRKAAAYVAERKVLKTLLQKLPVQETLPPVTPAIKSPEVLVEEKQVFPPIAEKPATLSFFDEIGTIVTPVKEAAPDYHNPVTWTPALETEVQPETSKVTQGFSESSATSSKIKENDKFFEELQNNLKELRRIRAKAAGIKLEENEEKKPVIENKISVQKIENPAVQTQDHPPLTPSPEAKQEQKIGPAPVADSPIIIDKKETTFELIPEKIKEHAHEEDLISSREDDVIVSDQMTDRAKPVDEKELLLNYLSFLETSKKNIKERKKTEDIIDRFIKEDPMIPYLNKNALPEEQEDKASHSYKLKSNPVSENMAKIFILQGKKDKAIEIYEQLILKNPEKKAYFASQIEKLK